MKGTKMARWAVVKDDSLSRQAVGLPCERKEGSLIHMDLAAHLLVSGSGLGAE